MNIDTTDTNSNNGTVSKTVAKLSPAKRKVYDAFVEFGPMTDDDLVEKSGIKKGTSSPRRNDLVKLGLIEQVATVETPTGTKVRKWGLVPSERIAEAMSKANSKGPRKRPVTTYPLEMRLEIVRQLLDMNDVNDAIREKHGGAWSRARGRANDRRGERNRELRANDAMLREAEERGSPQAEYFKLRRILLQSQDRVLAVNRLVSEELDLRNSAEGLRVPPSAWPDVADLLNDLARTCDETIARIKEVVPHLGDEIIEGTVIEIDDYTLPEGDGEAHVA
jgi:predicted transcriptional regulator